MPEDRLDLGASADVHGVRQDRLLRRLAQPSRVEARARGLASHHQVGRARRGLELVLRRRGRVRRRMIADHWEIRANLGPHARPRGDGSGWLLEVSRDDQVARVMIEISEAAWSTDPVGLPEETRRALETDGRTELLKVLGHDDPPRVIRCGSTGCTYCSAAQGG